MITLPEAIALARRLHAGAVDKGGRPYIEHPLRVMERVSTPEEKVAAVLHDLLEDTALTAAHLVAAGCPTNVVQAVEALTRRPDETYATFVARAAADPVARVVKAADIADNSDPQRLAQLDPVEADRLREKYRGALAVLEGTPVREEPRVDALLMEPRDGGAYAGSAAYDCGACGLPAGRVDLWVFAEGADIPTFAGAPAVVTVTSCLGRSASRIEEGQIERVRKAITSRDEATLQRFELAPFWCPTCPAAYCTTHWRTSVVMDEGFYDYTDGICPEGHVTMLDD